MKKAFTLFALLLSAATFAQPLLVSIGDSLVADVPNPRGVLQWEFSIDSVTWTPVVGQNTATLAIEITTIPAYYRLEMVENSCATVYSDVVETQPFTPFTCGDSISHGFVLGVTPDNTTAFQTRSYATVQAGWTGAGGGKCWTKMNLGATNAATTATATTAATAGWYFQFNRAQGYDHDGTNRTPNTAWINPINENTDWTPAADPCTQLLGAYWRIPTQAEWNAFLNASTATGGVGAGDLTDAFSSTLELHAGGNLSGGDGSSQNRGSQATFWSSGQNSNNTAGSFRFSTIGSFPVNATKNFAYPVRCIRD
ncbi:MAG: hypothetical protein LAT76_03935 [Schleiferiaceae bacterium]|nr:hypothetical protein [Schleiferiaceae bacterium]